MGRETDVVIDCSGVELAINQGFEIVKKEVFMCKVD